MQLGIGERWAPKINLKKMGVSPSFFFWDAHLLFFLMGGFPLDAHRPPIFFFWDAHLLHFFLMGVFLRFFFNPQKIKSKIWLLDTFLLLLKQIPFFWKFIRPSFAHLFFFWGAHLLQKKKMGAIFWRPSSAHLFFSAHLSPIPTE